MNNKKDIISKGLAAGMIIGLCCEVYKQCPNQIVGAFLFGLGLVSICMCKLNLFTGKVGSSNDIKFLMLVFATNCLGVLIMHGAFYVPNPLSLGIGCGILMQIGVVAYQKNLPFITVMCIAAFLLGGFAHCIAKMYYPLTIEYPLIVLGNIIGAKIIYYLGVKVDE